MVKKTCRWEDVRGNAEAAYARVSKGLFAKSHSDGKKKYRITIIQNIDSNTLFSECNGLVFVFILKIVRKINIYR